jgi:hypothetical protein
MLAEESRNLKGMRGRQGRKKGIIDDQELKERGEAARRYGEEDPDIYVDFAHSCIKESEDANIEVRNLWDQCYRAYRAQGVFLFLNLRKFMVFGKIADFHKILKH